MNPLLDVRTLFSQPYNSYGTYVTLAYIILFHISVLVPTCPQTVSFWEQILFWVMFLLPLDSSTMLSLKYILNNYFPKLMYLSWVIISWTFLCNELHI